MARQRAAEEQRKGFSITVRVTPRTKFVVDLLTRVQNRSVTALFEAFVARAEDEEFGYASEQIASDGTMGTIRKSLIDELWDTDDISRLANLASIAPKLMTYEEQVLWRIIRDEPGFWLETQQSLPLSAPECETAEEEQARLTQRLASMPSPFRYKVLDTRIFPGQTTEYWLDMLLTRKAWPDIQRAANQDIAGDELSAIVAELAKTIDGVVLKHRVPPPREDECG